jgi:hypothetical protein
VKLKHPNAGTYHCNGYCGAKKFAIDGELPDGWVVVQRRSEFDGWPDVFHYCPKCKAEKV